MAMQTFVPLSNKGLISLSGLKGVYSPAGSEANREELAKAVMTWVMPEVMDLSGRPVVWYL